MRKPTKPTELSADNELALEDLDQVVGGAGSGSPGGAIHDVLSAPSNFVSGVVGGAIFGPTATNGQMGVFGDNSQTGFAPGAEIGMGLNAAIADGSNLGNAAANVAGFAASAYDAAHDIGSSIATSVGNYFSPTPGNGAPGDTYVAASSNADGSINPGHFDAPTTDTSPGSLADQAGINDIGHSGDAVDHSGDAVDHSGDAADHSGDAAAHGDTTQEAGSVDHTGDGVDHTGDGVQTADAGHTGDDAGHTGDDAGHTGDDAGHTGDNTQVASNDTGDGGGGGGGGGYDGGGGGGGDGGGGDA
jgi:hypothetical protein